MKISHWIFLPFVLAFTGCFSSGAGQRVVLDSLGTGAGGAAAYFAGDGDPALTTAGAVGGFVVSEAFQSMARAGREKAYRSGIEEGKAIGQQEILHGLWEESNGLPRNNSHRYQTISPWLTVPARSQNGAFYDSHTAPSQVVNPEKIWIPASSTNDTPRYEIFQQGENP